MTNKIHSKENIIRFWYSETVREMWFKSTTEFDQQLRSDYEPLWHDAAGGHYDHWKSSAEGCLALCIILDQFPLNMYRNEVRCFSTEAQAIAVAKHAIDAELDQRLAAEKRVFLYMPLMHSEMLQDQELSVRCYTAAALEDNARFAQHHRDIVKQFGRFPHRNSLLGRESTPDEIDYLNSKEAFTG